jgi:hypothetical protein
MVEWVRAVVPGSNPISADLRLVWESGSFLSPGVWPGHKVHLHLGHQTGSNGAKKPLI